MDNFSIELASSILNLEFQKDKLINEDKVSKRLCSCRNRILKNFVTVCQLLHIRVMAILIKFCEDFDKDKTISFIDLRKWYYTEMYDKLYRRNCVTNKMILMLKLLQHSTDDLFFEHFNEKFKSIIVDCNQTCSSDQFIERLRELNEFLNDWMEEHILGILSLKINCASIKDDILLDFPESIINTPPISCKSIDCSNCEDRLTCNNSEEKEDIHLYITEEALNHNYICNFLDLILKYHKNPKEINIIVDFQLLENHLVFNENMYFKFKEAKKLFKEVNLVNCDKIYFGKFEDLIS